MCLCCLSTIAADIEDSSMVRFDENGTHTPLKFVDREIVTYFWWYIVIGIVWMTEFAIAIQELIVAGTVAEWFFTR